MIRTFLRFLGILGTPLGHPRGNSSISTSILHQPPTSNQPCFVESNKFLQGVSYCIFSLCFTILHESGHTNMAVPYYSSPICQALHSPVHFLIIFTMVTLSTLFHKVITLVILQGNDMQLKLQKIF